ncbi:hypothetical protein [Litorimonas sp.]|jgi:hypothetical protein|uniref:hypothetical protein n=1 Tax=Litorimonas sp. TaxID=1892381 RepID=UPI003A8A863C
MILRRLSKHVKDQNWFAVVLDFLIVVFGIIIGLQVTNWSEAKAFDAKETKLLHELKQELEASIRVTNQKRDAFTQVTEAGKRSLDFIARGESCETECWPIVVDFFHASQWQPIDVNQSTYEEMRRQGLPQSREIIDAVEAYLAQNVNLASTQILPAYRSRVRQMIPVNAQAYYWETCFDLDNGAETYVLDCPKGASDDVSAQTVDKILNSPDIEPFLTEWIGLMSATPSDLGEQNEAAKRAIKTINQELRRRR